MKRLITLSATELEIISEKDVLKKINVRELIFAAISYENSIIRNTLVNDFNKFAMCYELENILVPDALNP